MAQRIGPLDLNVTKRLVNIFAVRAGAWAPPAAGPQSSTSRPPLMGPGHVPPPQFAPPGAVPSSAPPPPRPIPPAPGVPVQAMTMPMPPGGGMMMMPPQQSHLRSYRPPFRNNETVFVGIPFAGDGFQLRKRLLGPQVSRVMNVINNIPGGNQNNIKIRLRGIGKSVCFRIATITLHSCGHAAVLCAF